MRQYNQFKPGDAIQPVSKRWMKNCVLEYREEIPFIVKRVYASFSDTFMDTEYEGVTHTWHIMTFEKFKGKEPLNEGEWE